MKKKNIYSGLVIIIVISVSIAIYYASQKYKEKEVHGLISELKSENSYDRELASVEIRKYGNAAIEPLIKLLIENQNEEIQADAIKSLGLIKNEKAAAALLIFLKKTHKSPNEVTDALVEIGSPAIRPLFEAFDDRDDFIRSVVLGALNSLKGKLLGDEKTIENMKQLFLRAFLYDNSLLVRKTALPLLGQSQFENDPEIKSIIKNALNDENGDIRGIALVVLQREKGKIYLDKNEIDNIIRIVNGVEHYYALYKRFPDNLNILAKENIIKKERFLNPWGYIYIYIITKDRKSFDLISVGKDGIRNTDDDTFIKWEE